MQIYLGGHLSWYSPQKQSRIEHRLLSPVLLHELVLKLGLPPAEIGVAVLNGHVVSTDEAWVSENDSVELYPPIGGGSAASEFCIGATPTRLGLRPAEGCAEGSDVFNCFKTAKELGQTI